MDDATLLAGVTLVMALGCALVVRPWRLLPGLATPVLAVLVITSWLWAWPGLAALPLPLRWSAAPAAVLLLGWPLAVPVLTLAGFSMMFTAGLAWEDALTLTSVGGVLPATLVLMLGHVVRRTLGPHPVAYLFGRAFFVPMAALLASQALALGLQGGVTAQAAELRWVAALLLALGEASWTCALASLLVAYRPRWLATWSDALYLGRVDPARALQPARIRR